VCLEQGDLIGRLFTYFAQLKSKDAVKMQFGYVFHGKSYDALIKTNDGLCYILGDFFTNSSGHSGLDRKYMEEQKH
jgi:hypothetical protein